MQRNEPLLVHANVQEGRSILAIFVGREGMISAQDVHIFARVDTAEEIVAIIQAFHGGKPPIHNATLE